MDSSSANFIENGIKKNIEKGIEYEKIRNISGAMECYLKALAEVDETTEESDKIALNIRIGDIYQLTGYLDDALNRFQDAYKEALGSGKQTLQVDSLIRIANVFLYKNEAIKGIKYMEEADGIILNFDYIKGKLESSVFWARYYYLNQEAFKAREICISALKSCGNGHVLEKGKLLNIFAELSSSLVSKEEYLSLLNEAYECFKKAEYERGMLGVLNNIGHVYNARIHDYKKALEYFVRLKNESENSIFVEFGLIAYMNMGEMYFKLLNYEEAIKWFLEAKSKPSAGPYADSAELYNNIFISYTYLKLYDFSSAYKYFMLASKEVNSGSTLRGTTLINYYNLASALFAEIGKVHEAVMYNKKALEAGVEDVSILKWETGTIYEQLKLKRCKNKTDVLGVLEGVRHLATKFKNTDTVLDLIYNFSLQLVDYNYRDLAFKLAEKYVCIKSDLEVIALKREYLNLIIDNSYSHRFVQLENLLKQSINLKEHKMTIRILNTLGDCFEKTESYCDAVRHYKSACDYINKMASGLPEDLKAGVLKSSYYDEIFNKLAEVEKFNL
jgi:tetratricopeptide (TPR) repeat protein